VKIYEDRMLTVRLSSSEKEVQLRTVLLALFRLVNEIGGVATCPLALSLLDRRQRAQGEQSVRIWTAAQRWTRLIVPGQRLNPELR
jgi:hypothetical protein